MFKLLSSSQTHVNFNDALTESLNNNVLMYEYFYNGAGVAVGDLNNDGFDDIYFTGNMVDNKLYLNKGRMKFEDITTVADVAGRPGPWKTGTTLVDVNGDKKLDIFVCYSGKLSGKKRIPQLFVNQGNDAEGRPSFVDEAAVYGLADSAYCNQVFFFDYDRDGDLDMLQTNHNPKRIDNIDDATIASLLAEKAPQAGTRLLRNDDDHFVDVTTKSGIVNTILSYNLGAGIADVNGDGWLDIYISNDYLVPDYLYINNKNGTFSNDIERQMGHISQFSMGNDIADVNNDGLPDIFTSDMLPEDNRRQKLLFAPDNYEEFGMLVRSGFQHQYMRNMLQMNNGDGTFSETGQLAGISNTDWSWAPLIADYDNDGWKDLFVTNGAVKDYTDMEFLKYMTDYLQQKRGQVYRQDLFNLVKQMPPSNVSSYVFKNNGDATFENEQQQWGIQIPSSSNGAAYADLDNDGDLDLVVNNINQEAFIYQNEANKLTKNNYLNIKLVGQGKNTLGIGAKVNINVNGKKQYLEQMPTKGYQSSVSPILHFGLGKVKKIDTLQIEWLCGKKQVVIEVNANQLLTLDEKNATSVKSIVKNVKSLFSETKSPLDYRHPKNAINDFKRQPLLIKPLSFSGPCLVKGDVNNDGLPDVFAGGSNGQPAKIYVQQRSGQFIEKVQQAFEQEKFSEDVDAVFFDANGDGTLDLYVASGGYHNFLPNDPLLQDRLYLNDGKGNFRKDLNAIPKMQKSSSCVRTADVNGDGYLDIFIGAGVTPGRYPEVANSYLLINNGKGKFSDQCGKIAPELQNSGMVTDALWVDMNGDNQKDLVVVGEWMPVSIYINKNGKLTNQTARYLDKSYLGWWNKIGVGDFNGDGKADLVIGNMGLNTQLKASVNEPATLYYKDFDGNGAVDPIFCFYIQHKSYPYVTRDELLDQISIMRTRFPNYKSYADASFNEIFTEVERKGASRLKVNCSETIYLESSKMDKYIKKKLPIQAQYSPVYAIKSYDYNKDGHLDLLLCGNINHARLRFGKSDANYGVLLKNDGKGNFTYINQLKSGFHLTGDVRSILEINNKLVFGINQQELKTYKIN